MRIVNLDDKYKHYLLKYKFKELHEFGIGLYVYLNNFHIFIPMTEQKRSFHKNDNRFFPIGKNQKYGTLLIGSYIYLTPQLFKQAKEDQRISDEIIFFKENKNKIKKQLKFQINRSKNHHDKEKIMWLNEYLSAFIETNRKKALKYTKKAVQSMAVIEKVNFTAQEIDDIIELNVLDRTDTYEVKTIFNLKDAWEHMIKTLYEPLNLEYIILINEKIANHQALKVGIIRDAVNSVSGEFQIEIPKSERLNKLISKFNISTNVEKDTLELFYKIILEQWFYDGNKRTAFIIANKALISNGIGVLLITDETQEQFNKLLYDCYKTRACREKEELLKFLSLECITR